MYSRLHLGCGFPREQNFLVPVYQMLDQHRHFFDKIVIRLLVGVLLILLLFSVKLYLFYSTLILKLGVTQSSNI